MSTMPPLLRLLGWNSLQIFLGKGTVGRLEWEQVPLNLKPSDIRNCSFAARPQWIGFTAEDRSRGDQILGIHELETGLSRVLRRFDYVLHHALNSSGTKVCYTRPSATHGTADLHLYDLEDDSVRPLLSGASAQDSIPAWFPDHKRIAFHTPDGHIATVDLRNRDQRRLMAGRTPAVDSTGTQIAFRRGDSIFTWTETEENVDQLELEYRLRQRRLVDGLSWMPGEQRISFATLAGLSDKERRFHLVSLLDGAVDEIDARHLRGLIIL